MDSTSIDKARLVISYLSKTSGRYVSSGESEMRQTICGLICGHTTNVAYLNGHLRDDVCYICDKKL